jgi:hypothetical protein
VEDVQASSLVPQTQDLRATMGIAGIDFPRPASSGSGGGVALSLFLDDGHLPTLRSSIAARAPRVIETWVVWAGS